MCFQRSKWIRSHASSVDLFIQSSFSDNMFTFFLITTARHAGTGVVDITWKQLVILNDGALTHLQGYCVNASTCCLFNQHRTGKLRWPVKQQPVTNEAVNPGFVFLMALGCRRSVFTFLPDCSLLACLRYHLLSWIINCSVHIRTLSLPLPRHQTQPATPWCCACQTGVVNLKWFMCLFDVFAVCRQDSDACVWVVCCWHTPQEHLIHCRTRQYGRKLKSALVSLQRRTDWMTQNLHIVLLTYCNKKNKLSADANSPFDEGSDQCAAPVCWDSRSIEAPGVLTTICSI